MLLHNNHIIFSLSPTKFQKAQFALVAFNTVISFLLY